MAAASLQQLAQPRLTCVVLDARDSSRAGARAELFRRWVGGMKEMLALEPHIPLDFSILTVQDGYYESCLPLGRHAPSQLGAALARLERRWIFGALGVAGDESPSPRRSAAAGPRGAKRHRGGHSSSPTRRLFAVGEDSAAAALRSAAAQLAAALHMAGSSPDVSKPAARLELWTAEPERLRPVAGDLARSLRPGIEVLIFIVGVQGLPPSELEAQAQLLEQELRPPAGSGCGPLRARALPATAAAFARELRWPLDISLPVLLRLPRVASVRDLRLAASPCVVLPMAWRRNILATLEGTMAQFDVISRVPQSGVSLELVHGTPLIAELSPVPKDGTSGGDVSLETRAWKALIRTLTERKEGLVLKARLNPETLSRAETDYVFLALPHGAAISLRGLVFAEIWNPEACPAADGAPLDDGSPRPVAVEASLTSAFANPPQFCPGALCGAGFADCGLAGLTLAGGMVR